MGLFDSAGRQLGGAWSSLSLGHRLILLLLCALCVGGLVAVSYWASTPEYALLSAELGAKECAELAGALRDEGIDARIGAGGDAVLVPRGSMAEARMLAAQKGVFSKMGKGFDAFQDPKIGMTPFAERINYLSALQQELATTISTLEEVNSARVHLVIPERSLFKRDERRASASVLVAMRGGGRLSVRNATAVANLVANAVSGLAAEDVTISDGHGNVLAGGRERGPEVSADDQWSYRRTVEDDLARKAETMLTKVLGPGRCEVRVSAELAFEDTKETRREYSPSSRVVVSETIESSKSSGGGYQVGGPAGAGSNTPAQGQSQAANAQSPSTSETENIDTKYVVGESVRETVNRGATIKRISVAALVDTTPEQAEGGERAEDQAEPATAPAMAATMPAMAATMPAMADISQIIKDAVGFDESRGDSLKIVEAELRPPAAQMAESPGRLPAWAVEAGRYFAVAVLGLVLLLVARRALGALESATPRQVIVPEVIDSETGGSYPAELSQDELLRREVAKIVQNDPKSAGRLLEGWIEAGE